MRTALLSLVLLPVLWGLPAVAQAPQPAGSPPQAQAVEGSKPMASSQQVKSGPFRAGAAKVDITPDLAARGAGNPGRGGRGMGAIEGILDHIYVRAIVVDNGAATAALVAVDTGAIMDQVWRVVSQRTEKELGIPAQNLLLTPTHTHSASAGTADQIFNAIKEAKEKLQPARIGYGTGVSYINVQRNIIDPKTHKWWEGANYDGPSDKTVAVIQFEATNGEPIAVYYNYACHAVVTGNTDMLSGDWPGAASRYIEDSFDDKIVAVFSVGAQGDQNPIYFQQTFDLREIRIKDYAARGQDISNAMPPGGQGLNKQDPTVKKLLDQQKQMIISMGQFMGEEVKRVMRLMDTARMATGGRIFASQKMVSFPGRNRTNQGRAGIDATYVDGPDVQLRLSLLMIDDIALGGGNAEIFTMISERFKRESPIGRSIFVSMVNGSANSGYIPDDASFGQQTFEVLSSRCKPGYAESAIVNGILDMMADVK
jgi:hypothetical protein